MPPGNKMLTARQTRLELRWFYDGCLCTMYLVERLVMIVHMHAELNAAIAENDRPTIRIYIESQHRDLAWRQCDNEPQRGETRQFER